MNYKISLIAVGLLFYVAHGHADEKKVSLGIILGSTRQGRTSEKIGMILKDMLAKRADVHAEVIDIKSYNLPFLYEETAPAYRKEIVDSTIKKWSNKIASMQAFIMVTPEYNGGYPGVLKNALDLLYKEWNNKPVAFVGYSGGPSGAAHAIAQLRQVVAACQMVPAQAEVLIPTAWKAFDTKGSLIKNIEPEIQGMVDELVRAVKQ